MYKYTYRVSKHQRLHGLESEWRLNVFWKPLALERIFGLGTQGNVRSVNNLGIKGTWLRPTADTLGEEIASNLKGPRETGSEARSTHNEHMLILLISIFLITLPAAS